MSDQSFMDQEYKSMGSQVQSSNSESSSSSDEDEEQEMLAKSKRNELFTLKQIVDEWPEDHILDEDSVQSSSRMARQLLASESIFEIVTSGSIQREQVFNGYSEFKSNEGRSENFESLLKNVANCEHSDMSVVDNDPKSPTRRSLLEISQHSNSSKSKKLLRQRGSGVTVRDASSRNTRQNREEDFEDEIERKRLKLK